MEWLNAQNGIDYSYLTMSLGIFEVGINPRQMSELTLPNCQNGHCIYL